MRPFRLTPVLALIVASALTASAADPPDRAKILATMKSATAFMVDKVSCHGGYVWSYLPDFSRRWGEMEAKPTMIWMQSGTADMGNAFLDAYRATKDEYYYQAAAQVAGALIAAQHPSGGWPYIHDFAGEESLKHWYATVGQNGWRLEEFQHYYGNATFDDSTTSDPATFMLRLYLEKRDPRFKASLNQAIGFVLASQYPCGGWPQRFPLVGGFSKDGLPDYTGFITLNDAVASGNIDFLILCYQTLGDTRLLDPIRRGMDIFVTLQQPAPQAGWALQYSPDLKPAGARTYEPKALVTHTTAVCIEQMLKFYRLTGEKKFLARLPEALDWLDAVKLPAGTPGARGSHPTFVEIGTNEPLFVHRTGSNATNGRYFADHHPENTVGHYSSFRSVEVGRLREHYRQALATPLEEATKDSPLRGGAARVDPASISWESDATVGGGFFGRGAGGTVEERAARAIAALNADGCWLTPLRSTSHPYKGDGPKEIAPGDFLRTQVGDDYDTSPFGAPEAVTGISINTYLANMRTLIASLEAKP